MNAETLARVEFAYDANLNPDPNTGPMTWDQLTPKLKEIWLRRAAAILASPEWKAHEANRWREGHAAFGFGASEEDNPYEAKP